MSQLYLLKGIPLEGFMPSSWCVAEGINLHALQQREVNSKLSHRVGIEDG